MKLLKSKTLICSKQHKVDILFSWVVLGLGLLSINAEANFRYSAQLGFGASNVQRDVIVDKKLETVARGQGPLVFGVGVDYPMGDYLNLAAEHFRGIQLSPFASSVTFTGFAVKWHFLAPIPTVPESMQGQTVLIRREWSLYAGLGFGVASASVKREFDLPQVIEESGFYFTPKLGAEIQLSPGMAGKMEIQMPNASGDVVAQGSVSGMHFLVGLIYTP